MPLIIQSSLVKLKDKLKPFMVGPNPAFEDDELERALDEAVEEYGRHRPLRVLEEFSLVPGQPFYDFPEDALRVYPLVVTDALMPTALFSSIRLPEHEFTAFFAQYFESPALSARFHAYRTGFYKSTSGTVIVDDAKRIIQVRPTPLKSMTVKIPVIKAYTKEVLMYVKQYSDVNTDDTAAILDLCSSILIRRIAMALSLNNMKVADMDYRGSFSAKDLQLQADDLEERFRARVVLPVAGRG